MEAAQHEAVAAGPAQLATGHGEREVGEAVEQAAERDAGFEPGQRRAEAVVDAVPEAHVASGSTVDVEAVRVDEGVGIAVGAGQADEDLLARRDLDAGRASRARSSPGTWRGEPVP